MTAQRTAQAFAQQMTWLLDKPYPDAAKGHGVLDNLNTHTPAGLYQTFAPAEARRRLRRLEFHFTPTHGRWLNMAEIELAGYTPQCLDRPIPDEDTLARELTALTQERHAAQATIRWRFTCQDARVKLSRLYPSLSG